MTFELPPTKRIYVRYRLTGVVQSSGGPDTRALARITALDVSTSTRLVHTTLNVVGAQVLALACTPKGRRRADPMRHEARREVERKPRAAIRSVQQATT